MNLKELVSLFCFLLIFNTQHAMAIEVIKCQDNSGNIIYQDKPCLFDQVSEVFEAEGRKVNVKHERGIVFESNDSGDVKVFELTSGWSNLILTIPKAGMSPPSIEVNRSRFEMINNTEWMIISGWLEPEAKFPGIRKVWQGNVTGWRKKKLPIPEVVTFSDKGNWEVVEYINNIDDQQQFSIESHRVEAGTWIHLHLSIFAQKIDPSIKAKLHKFMQQIKVKLK